MSLSCFIFHFDFDIDFLIYPPTPWGPVCESLIYLPPIFLPPLRAENPCGSTGCCTPLSRLLHSTPGLLRSTPFFPLLPPPPRTRHLLCSKHEISCVANKTCRVFQTEHFLCSTQNISCVPSRTFRVFQAIHCVCSISSYHLIIISSCQYYHKIITSSYHNVIITSYHHIIISSCQRTKKVQVRFGPKVKKKIEIDLFTPPAKIKDS